MDWLLPAGAWAFVSLVGIVVLYLLRRKAKEYKVPSLLLWRRAESTYEAITPFQRLRKQWLLILQLLLAALLSLALMRPALPGGLQGERVLIFDLSASMQTQVDGVSRLEEAKEDAITLVDALQEGDAVTILTAGSSVGQVAARSTDRQRLKADIRGLEAENGTADVREALSLAEAMGRDVPELSAILYTDTQPDGAPQVELRPAGVKADNCAVLSLQCSQRENGLLAFARVANYGDSTEISVECYADGVLCDIRGGTLEGGGQESVQFSVPGEAQAVWVTIATKDGLEADNTRFWVAQKQRERRVLLVTDGNVFLEKALALREDVQVYKTTASDAESADGYDLYIFDGDLPQALPQNGAIWALAPDREVMGLELEPDVEVKQASGSLRKQNSAIAQAITQNLALDGLALRTFAPVRGGQSILTYGEQTLLAVGDLQGRRIAVMGFDLHDSNLPMKADFPVLVQNLLEYLLPEPVGAVDATACGLPISLALDERTVSAQMITPSGRTVAVSGGSFADTNEIGIYALQEERADGTRRTTFFSLHVPLSESDVRQVPQPQGESSESAVKRRAAGQEITLYALLAALLVLLLEWGVSRRGA